MTMPEMKPQPVRRWLHRLVRWLSAWAWTDECRKLTERKTVHQWLNTRGTPSIEATGKPMCLLRRLAVALDVAPHHAPTLKESLRVEVFVCGACGAEWPSEWDHCPACLWSPNADCAAQSQPDPSP